MRINNKPIIWLHGEVKTPPFGWEARIEAGFLLRQLQEGIKLSLPQSRPMPAIGGRCHELRVTDQNMTWRIIYQIDSDAIVILEVFDKKSNQTPRRVIDVCKDRINRYWSLS